MSGRIPAWLGLAEALTMIGCAGVAGVLAYAWDADPYRILAYAVIASAAGKFLYRWIKK